MTTVTRNHALRGVWAAALVVASAWTWPAFDAAAATVLSSNASARYGSGNTTYAKDEVSGFALPDNGSTGLLSAANTNLATFAEGSASLSLNAIGAGGGWIGGSVIDHPPNGGTIWNLVGNAMTRFQDRILVSSATLPVGTPVQIEFAFEVAASLGAVHSVFDGGNNNRAFAQGYVSANISQNTGVPYFLDSADHHAITDTTTAINDFALGMMNPQTPHLSVTIDAVIGDNLFFHVQTNANTNGNLAPIAVSLNPITLDNTAGSAHAAIGLAFGATPLTAGVTLLSERLGGAFPDAALANAVNAAAAMPVVPVPVPAAVALLAAGLGMLGGVVRQRRVLRPAA